MNMKFTRRRAITVLAAVAGLPLLMKTGSAQARLARWEGTAMGAQASIQLYHADETKAQAALDAAQAELRRLESIFSLHRADSALAALNRHGQIQDAPLELVELTGMALTYAEITEGAFDPTVQPLWQLYFRHFTQASPDQGGPAQSDIDHALALVNWQGVEIDGQTIGFARSGMGLTLNGIAQGYITDRVAAVLKSHGFESMLVDMGEPRAMAAKPDGSSWRIGIANPADSKQALTEISVSDQAVATSGGYGTLFDDQGRFTHLFEPKSGATAPALAGVTVVAGTAAKADALSTALSVAHPDKRQAIVARAGNMKAIFVTPKGVVSTIDA
jgi:thiamine biosynthesis lipoprotein